MLVQVASTLAAHEILPYLSRSYLFFFIVGSHEDAQEQLRRWGIPVPEGEVVCIDIRTAETYLETGGERETLAYVELQHPQR